MAGTHLDTRYKYELSPRQREVMELVARGYTNPQIAERLGVSLDGAKYHVREILAKLEVSSREEAVERWREMQAPGSRLRRAWSGVFAGGGFRAAVLGLGGGALVVAAVIMVLALSRGDNDEPPAAPLEPTATVRVLPSTTTVVAATDDICDPSKALLDVQLVPDGDEVLVRLSANVATPCRLIGPSILELKAADDVVTGATQPHANLERSFKVALDLPVDGVFAEWRWMNWCDARPDRGWVWHAVIGEGSQYGLQLSGFRPVDLYPACVASLAPSSATVERFAPGVDGDVYPIPDCGQAGWICQFAWSLAVTGPDAFSRILANGLPTTYRCSEAGHVDGAEYSTLCEGATEGDSREGYPLARHGAEGGPVSRTDLILELQRFVGQSPRLASIGGPTDGALDWFIVAFPTGSSPEAVYLAFELVPGREPALVAAGVSGDNAGTILGGGTTMTVMGEAQFVALPPQP